MKKLSDIINELSPEDHCEPSVDVGTSQNVERHQPALEF